MGRPQGPYPRGKVYRRSRDAGLVLVFGVTPTR